MPPRLASRGNNSLTSPAQTKAGDTSLTLPVHKRNERHQPAPSPAAAQLATHRQWQLDHSSTPLAYSSRTHEEITRPSHIHPTSVYVEWTIKDFKMLLNTPFASRSMKRDLCFQHRSVAQPCDEFTVSKSLQEWASVYQNGKMLTLKCT
jgi:hypothetical protein